MNEVFSFRKIPEETRDKEGLGNGGQNKVEAALKQAKDKFDRGIAGRFFKRLEQEPRLLEKNRRFQKEVLFGFGIWRKRRMGFMESLKRKGFVDVEKSGSEFVVTKIYKENIEKMIEENLYDRELLRFIRAEENQGMSLNMIVFYTKKSKDVTDKKIKNLIDLGLIVGAMPTNKPSRYYFSPDFVIEGEPAQTTEKMVAAVRKREEEFKEKSQMMENKKV